MQFYKSINTIFILTLQQRNLTKIKIDKASHETEISERKEKRKKTERKRSYVYNHRVDNVRK